MMMKMGGLGFFACGILLLCAVSSVNSYSKYGRGCADIGCLPSEECVITADSCNYNQRDGKDCGNYPTCKRKVGGGSTSSSVHPSGSSLKPGPEINIFSAGSSSSNPTLNTHAYINHNGNGAKPGSSSNGYQTNAYLNKNSNNNNNNNNNYNSDYGSANGNGNGAPNGGGNGQNGGNGNNPSIIDPHYVFGAPQSVPILPNLPIFPYNSPTIAPSFQQFPQPNHPGSVLNPGVPHGLQPVNPYNSPFVFGQQPYYNSPGGTGGPPGGSNGILGGSGGGLAPYPGGYPSPNSYNKPPPQYQNQNPYNRQTQTHPHNGGRSIGIGKLGMMMFIVMGVFLQKIMQTTASSST